MLMPSFSVPMLGTLLLMMSAHRISIARSFSPRKHRAFFVTAGFFPLIARFFVDSEIVLWCLIGSLVVFLRAADAFFPRFSRDFSLEETLNVLDRAILSMKSGRSLKFSFQEILRGSKRSPMSRVLQEFVARFEHGGDFPASQPVAREFLREISAVQARGTRVIAGLESLRSVWRARFIFRRRSGQISLQSRLQAAIACLLYAPLLIFQIRAGNFFDPRTQISLALFGAAQLWIHFAFRSYKWKV